MQKNVKFKPGKNDCLELTSFEEILVKNRDLIRKSVHFHIRQKLLRTKIKGSRGKRLGFANICFRHKIYCPRIQPRRRRDNKKFHLSIYSVSRTFGKIQVRNLKMPIFQLVFSDRRLKRAEYQRKPT